MAVDYFRTSGIISSTYVGVHYQPVVKLDLMTGDKLDPRFTFTRTSSATYINSIGNYTTAAANIPRLDHDPVTLERKGLLLEEPRTNIVYWSADPNQISTWVNSGTITTSALAADAVFTPIRVAAGASHLIWHRRQGAMSTTLTAGVKYTATILYKPGTSGNIYVALYSDASNYCDLFGPAASPSINTVLGMTINAAPVVKVHKSGIYQLTFTFTTDSTLQYSIGVGPGTASTGQYIDFYGAQIEASQAATSFIVTGSTAPSLDRTRDECYMSGINTMLSGQATLMCESIMSGATTGGFVASLYSTSTNYLGLGYSSSGGAYNGVSYFVNTTVYNSDVPGSYGAYDVVTRIATAYDSSSAVTYYSGNKLAHSGTYPSAITPQTLYLGARSASGDFDSNVWIRKVFLYDKKIDEEDMLFITRL